MSFKDKVIDAGQAVKEKVVDASHVAAETAKTAGHKIADGAEQATDWVKDKTGLGHDKGVAGIQERMDVIASCGKKIGVVDHFEQFIDSLNTANFLLVRVRRRRRTYGVNAVRP